MKTKITNSELINAVAARAGISKKDALAYSRALQDIFDEALASDKIIKIAEFGTFKLLWKARKSGQSGRFQITFAPHPSFSELVNAPLSHLDAVELVEDEPSEKNNIALQKLSEQAVELQGLLSDINHVEPLEAVPDNIPTASLNELETKYAENRFIDNEIAPAILLDAQEPKKSGRKIRLWIIILSVIALLLLLGWKFGGAYTASFVEKVSDFAGRITLFDGATSPEQAAIPLVSTDSLASDMMAVFNVPRHYTEMLATEKVRGGDNLAALALKYYGHKYFWVYIFEANRDVLKHPNIVRAGQVIRIPKVDSALIDPQSDACLQYAWKLHLEYVNIPR
ncbi:MAG: HU family DNA-binding protein [Prevotellaceae bacterium]|jgi:nucleoid DNA-binding protein/phage tail protein X|nr:HU family DNA-binding protein [Prevotellaceae bacterium]